MSNLDSALAFLRERGKYVLDAGTPKPNWGRPDEIDPPMFGRVFFCKFPEISDEWLCRVDLPKEKA